jgi:hypothetical protein
VVTEAAEAAGSEDVARRTPQRSNHRSALLQDTDRSREHRKAIDEIVRTVDGINCPDSAVIIPRQFAELLSRDAMAWTAFGQH